MSGPVSWGSRSRLWAEWTWTDFAAADMAEVIVVLPVAAVEQHGPHLPVGTDHHIMEAYLGTVLGALPDDLPVLFLPVQSIGKSDEHVAYPGTLTLSAETVIRAWNEIGDSVARAGCRKLVLLNAHGGNVTSLDIVARDLRLRHGMLAVMASWHRFGYPDDLFDAAERLHGIHAGAIETSLMLDSHAGLVRHDALADFVPDSVAMEHEFRWLRPNHPIGFGWASQDLSASGAMGDAAAATAEKGRAARQHGVTAFLDLLRDIRRFDMSRLGRSPDAG